VIKLLQYGEITGLSGGCGLNVWMWHNKCDVTCQHCHTNMKEILDPVPVQAKGRV
jgi:hypothetical protein